MSYKRISPVPVIEGGTGVITMTTPYAPVISGTTATGALQVASTGLGTSGFVLTSTGSSSLPTFQAASITLTGDVGSAAGSNITLTGGTSGAVFTGAGSTMTESFNFLSLPSTTATDGQVRINGIAVLHSYGNTNSFVGSQNAAAGNFTLGTVTAINNTGMGAFALQGLTDGANNSAFGFLAAGLETTGSRNSVVGASSLSSSSGNSNNCILGFNCANGISGGSNNVIIGANGAQSITGASSHNVYINNSSAAGTESNKLRIGSGTGTGTQQLNAAYICGIDGVNVGSVAKVLTMASDQIGTATITAGTGMSVTPSANTITLASTGVITINGDSGSATGNTITFTGSTSGAVFTGAGSTVTESFNYLALPATTSTNGQVRINGNAVLHAQNGIGNIFVGTNAGNFTATANSCVGIGYQSLLALTSGDSNTCVGRESGLAITSGSNNIAIGYGSLKTNQTASSNIAIGYNALGASTTGNHNVAIGCNGAGGGGLSALTTGAFNVSIGTYDNASGYTGAESSNIIINNYSAPAGESNVLRIGLATGTGNLQLNKAFICGIDGINVGSVAKVVTMASDQLGTATITGGTGISITPSANTITVGLTGAASFTWSVITVNQTAVVNNGYICNKAGTLALALPATAAIGDIIAVTGINNANGWQITQAANQQIFFGASSTTLGATGTLSSSATRDSVQLVCVVAGASTVWNVVSSIGNLTLA